MQAQGARDPANLQYAVRRRGTKIKPRRQLRQPSSQAGCADAEGEEPCKPARRGLPLILWPQGALSLPRPMWKYDPVELRYQFWTNGFYRARLGDTPAGPILSSNPET